MTDRATAYAERVLDDSIVAGPHVRAQCERHLADLARDGQFVWDWDCAAKGIGWFEDVLMLGGKPFELYDWQAFVVGSLFGWRRTDGTRRFRRAYLETGKGSGKTPLAAGIALAYITADAEHRAEGYVCARTMDQALVTYRDIAALVWDTPALDERCRVLGGESPYNIVYHGTNSFLRRLAANDRGEGRSGYRPHVAIIDEYHEHSTSAMLDMMAAGVKSRRHPLILVTTNAGSSRNSPCGIEHDYACKVASGEVDDPAYFPYVCAMDEGDELTDRANWPKTNPSLPGIPGYEYIESMLAMAAGMPSKRAVVDRLIFCHWTEAESPWIDADIWIAAEKPEIAREGPCYAALDLSARTDLTAGTLVWNDGERLAAETTIWSPSNTLQQRADDDQAPYVAWAEAGHLVPVPGSAMDFGPVARWLIDAAERYDLRALAYDPHRMDELRREIRRHGAHIDGNGDLWIGENHVEMQAHPQGFMARGATGLGMSLSIDTAERYLHQGRLDTLANPAVRSAALGAVVVMDNSRNRRFVKLKSRTRIDPMVALVMAVGAATRDAVDLDWDAFGVGEVNPDA